MYGPNIEIHISLLMFIKFMRPVAGDILYNLTEEKVMSLWRLGRF